MAEHKARRAVRGAHRADDKRGAGLGDNNVFTVHAPGIGSGDPLVNFSDRRGRNGKSKRAV